LSQKVPDFAPEIGIMMSFDTSRGPWPRPAWAITAARVAHPGTWGDVTLHRPANTANASNGSCSRIH